jgi:hypothetical protein
VCLHVWRHCVELLLQFLARDAIDHDGMNCLAAERRERDLPSRLLDGDRESEPAVDGPRKRTGSFPGTGTRPPIRDESQDAPRGRPVRRAANGGQRRHDAVTRHPPDDPPDNPPGGARSR